MKKIALLYPGQGSQYVGMGKTLCNDFIAAKRVFEEANDILGFDLVKLCFEGDIEELTRTDNTQPALLTASVAAFRVYMEEVGIEPKFAAGHSLGEFSALACSGAMSFGDALRVVRRRGILMQEVADMGKGAMAAIGGADAGEIDEICRNASTAEEIASIACFNSPEQIVISGHSEAVGRAGEKLKEMGAQVTFLKVGAAFHSTLMKPQAEKLREELLKYNYNEPKWPIISNVTALPYKDGKEIVENLTLQLYQPVRWQESMEYLQKQLINVAVELGPKTVSKNLMKKNTKHVSCFAYDKNEDRKELIKLLNTKDKGIIPSLVSRCLAIAVCTKNSNWDEAEYQKGVIEPYRKIQQLQNALDKDGMSPSMDQMQDALRMLKSVFVTKKTPAEEQRERFEQILRETGMENLFKDFVESL